MSPQDFHSLLEDFVVRLSFRNLAEAMEFARLGLSLLGVFFAIAVGTRELFNRRGRRAEEDNWRL
jgi:hypothetical protein